MQMLSSFAGAFETDKHVSGSISSNNAEDQIKAKWKDKDFVAKYNRGDSKAISELTNLYNKSI